MRRKPNIGRALCGTALWHFYVFACVRMRCSQVFTCDVVLVRHQADLKKRLLKANLILLVRSSIFSTVIPKPATIGFGVWHLKQTFRFRKLRSLHDGQFLSAMLNPHGASTFFFHVAQPNHPWLLANPCSCPFQTKMHSLGPAAYVLKRLEIANNVV